MTFKIWVKNHVFLYILIILIITKHTRLFLIHQNTPKKMWESIGQTKYESTVKNEAILRGDSSSKDTSYQAKSEKGEKFALSPVSNRKYFNDTSDKYQKTLIDEDKDSFSGLEFSGKYPVLPFLSFFSSLRSALMNEFNLFFPQNHAALFIGLLLGGNEGFDVQIQQKLKNVGAQHIVSASGYNISLVLSLFAPLLAKVKNPLLFCTGTLLLLFLFLVISGFSVSLLRAAFMATLSVLSKKAYRRQYHACYALCCTAALFLFWDLNLLTELSFQLTFAATLGIILFAGSVSTKSDNSFISSVGKIFKENAQTTIAAQIFTFPLIWYVLGKVSVVGLFANLFFLVITPFLTIGVLAHMVLQYLPFLKYLSGGVVWLGGSLFFILLDLFDRFSHFVSFTPPKLSVLGFIAWCGLALGIKIYLSRGKERRIY